MGSILNMFKKDLKDSPPPLYRYELYGKTKENENMYAWINMDTKEWTHDDFKGKMLPRGAIKEYSQGVKDYQKKLLDKGQVLPQIVRPPVAINKETQEKGSIKKIFEFIKGL